MSRSPRWIRVTASATAPAHSVGDSEPSAKATSPGASTSSWTIGSTLGGSASVVVVVVTHHWSPRRPMTTEGTTSVAPEGESAAYEIAPKATGPVPGRSTSSRTTADPETCCHHDSSAANRDSP